MPYVKKQYRPRTRRTYKRKNLGYFGQAGNDAKKALSMAGKALSLLNTEFKYSDLTATLNPYSANPGINLLTGVAQGDSAVTRDGNSVKLQNLDLNILVQPNATTPSRNTIRLVLVRANNSDQVTPVGTSVYTSAAGAAPDILAQRNIINTKAYTVLKEKKITIDPSNGPAEKYLSIYLDFSKSNHHLKFAGTLATQQTDGRVYLIVYGNSSVLGTAPQVTYSSRIRFVDN